MAVQSVRVCIAKSSAFSCTRPRRLSAREFAGVLVKSRCPPLLANGPHKDSSIQIQRGSTAAAICEAGELPVTYAAGGLKYSIRNPVDEQEISIVAKLRAEAFYSGSTTRFVQSFKQQFAQKEVSSLMERTRPASLGLPECECLVATDNDNSGKVVGCVDIQLPASLVGKKPRSQESSDPTGAYIYNLVVDERHRRKGLGGALMEAAMARAVNVWRAPALYTKVDADNEVAYNLYCKFGFKEESVEARHAGTTALGRVVLLKATCQPPLE